MNDYEKIILEKIFETNNKNDLKNEFVKINSLKNNPAFRDLGNNQSIFGKIKNFIKRVIRKLTKFYVEPIATQQTEFNVELVKIIENMKDQIDNDKDNNLLAYNKLLNEIKKLNNENNELRNEIFLLKGNKKDN